MLSVIPYCDITKIFSFELEGKGCVEIEFMIKGYPKYQSCWMGKTPDKADKKKELYWYGLVSDGSEAYNYDNFEDFLAAPVFEGNSLKQIWREVQILSIDGCEPQERIRAYLETD